MLSVFPGAEKSYGNTFVKIPQKYFSTEFQSPLFLGRKEKSPNFFKKNN